MHNEVQYCIDIRRLCNGYIRDALIIVEHATTPRNTKLVGMVVPYV